MAIITPSNAIGLDDVDFDLIGKCTNGGLNLKILSFVDPTGSVPDNLNIQLNQISDNLHNKIIIEAFFKQSTFTESSVFLSEIISEHGTNIWLRKTYIRPFYQNLFGHDVYRLTLQLGTDNDTDEKTYFISACRWVNVQGERSDMVRDYSSFLTITKEHSMQGIQDDASHAIRLEAETEQLKNLKDQLKQKDSIISTFNMSICPLCDREYTTDIDSCSHCHDIKLIKPAKFEDIRVSICINCNCGHKFPLDHYFCDQCGATLIKPNEYLYSPIFICSGCNKKFLSNPDINFCPGCGHKISKPTEPYYKTFIKEYLKSNDNCLKYIARCGLTSIALKLMQNETGCDLDKINRTDKMRLSDSNKSKLLDILPN